MLTFYLDASVGWQSWLQVELVVATDHRGWLVCYVITVGAALDTNIVTLNIAYFNNTKHV